MHCLRNVAPMTFKVDILLCTCRDLFQIATDKHRKTLETVKKSVVEGTHNWQANISITGTLYLTAFHL